MQTIQKVNTISNRETMPRHKARQSNIELLRIISMLLIISYHYVYHSGYVFESLTVNSFIVKAFYMFGELGVNLFVLITGYFMINGKFSFKKLIRLVLEVEFCNILVITTASMLKIVTFNSFIGSLYLLFPIIFPKYWFVTAYILLYCFSPFLNILLKNMNKKTYKKFLVVEILIYSLIPTIFGVLLNTTESPFLLYYSRFIWFLIIYSIGAYINMYQINIFKKMKTSIKYAIIGMGVMFLSIPVIYKLKSIFGFLEMVDVAYFWPPNTIPMLITSVAVFEVFLKIKIKPNKVINKIASTTLCIYMLHDNILREYIWGEIFKANEHLNGQYPIIHILIATIIIFTAGMIIDLIRQFIEKYTVTKVLNSKFYERQSSKLSKLISRLLDLI